MYTAYEEGNKIVGELLKKNNWDFIALRLKKKEHIYNVRICLFSKRPRWLLVIVNKLNLTFLHIYKH